MNEVSSVLLPQEYSIFAEAIKNLKIMDVKVYWDKYINEDILDIFDITCKFFSSEMPENVQEEYDLVEALLETKGHHETAKEFDKVLKFTQLIKEKQSQMYQENFQYFDDTLIEYYSFQNEPAKVEDAFSNFMAFPIHDFDAYLSAFKILIFNGHNNLIDKAVTQNFDEVAESENLMGGAEYYLAMAKLYKALEELYLNYKKRQTVETQNLYETTQKFGFELDPNNLESVEKWICDTEFDHEYFSTSFKKNRKSAMEYLLGHFLKYMHQRNFSFILSGRIWDKIFEFWETNADKKQQKPTLDKYFNVHPNKFDEFLAQLSGDVFYSNKPEMIATLWGSVYVYDFLKQMELIDAAEHNNFIQATRKFKGIIIAQTTCDLWNFNFVHKWVKPDSISETEFVEEEKIFAKSFLFKEHEFEKFKTIIPEELENIGELSGYIIDGAKSVKKMPDYADILKSIKNNDWPLDSPQKEKILPEVKYVDPADLGNKVGRNDPCPCGSGKKYKKCCG